MSANPFDSFEEKNINKESIDPILDSDKENDYFDFGEEHTGTDQAYYDIYVNKFKYIIKPYNGNRIINRDRVKNIVDKYLIKPFFIPPLIVFHIKDDDYNINEYQLIDGQHRYEALKILEAKHSIMPKFTYVILTGTLEDAKETFKNINQNVKFEDLFNYENPAELLNKITAYFKGAVSNSDRPQSHKFNPSQLKEQIINTKLFNRVNKTVDEIFNEIKILNEQIYTQFDKKFKDNTLKSKEKDLFVRINNTSGNLSGNKMYLLLDNDWLLKLIAKLEKI